MKIMQENILEMGNNKAIAFTNCWICNQFLIMTSYQSKYIITISRNRKKHGNDVQGYLSAKPEKPLGTEV